LRVAASASPAPQSIQSIQSISVDDAPEAPRRELVAEVKSAWTPSAKMAGRVTATPPPPASPQTRSDNKKPPPPPPPVLDAATIEEKLRNIVIPEISFRQANLKDVIEFFSDVSREFDDSDVPASERGLRISLSDTVDALISSPDTANATNLITCSMRYISLKNALDAVMDSANLKYNILDGKILVESVSVEELKAKNQQLKTVPSIPTVNPFVDTASNPLSTFAIGADSASYTITRQSLENGAMPEPSVVRVEEFVNAFDYNDSPPERATFRFVVEGAPSPFGRDTQIIRLAIKGKRLGREEKRPANLTFLVDASGSMAQADRIGVARMALAELLNGLGENDKLQIIAFNDKARVVLQQCSIGMFSRGVSDTGKLPVRNEIETQVVLDTKHTCATLDILKAFDSIQPTGPTSLQDGIVLAYQMASATFEPGAENRVVLISDGVANLGSDNAEEILEQIASARRQGIRLSVFGVGRGAYNDTLLQQLANKGDGMYRFLDSPDSVKQAFVEDLAATLYTIASDAKVQVEWDPKFVESYRLLGYEARALTAEQFRDDSVVAGQIGSGQAASALYEIKVAATSLSPNGGKDASATLGTIRVRFRPDVGKPVQEISQPIRVSDIAPTFAKARPEFQIAAVAGGFAEKLRGSPYAPTQTYRELADLVRPAAQQLYVDPRFAELVRLLEAAGGMTR